MTSSPCDSQPGRIIAFRNDEVAVLTEGRGGCGRCQQPGGCGRPVLPKATTTWVKNDNDYQVGDEVLLHVATPALEKAAWVAYGVPLVGLIVGAGVGVPLGDAASVATALVGLWGGLAWVRWRTHKLAPHLWVTPVNES